MSVAGLIIAVLLFLMLLTFGIVMIKEVREAS
jgi:putative effector of murein hydrolase LrgA (UPF0299 family)